MFTCSQCNYQQKDQIEEWLILCRKPYIQKYGEKPAPWYFCCPQCLIDFCTVHYLGEKASRDFINKKLKELFRGLKINV